MSMWLAWVKRIVLTTAALLVAGVIVVALLWQNRAAVADVGWSSPEVASTISNETVTVTWLGVSTLLFDDGDTQILIDGFFSRPSLIDLVLDRHVDNDAAQINFAMNEYRMRRLAAIIPSHSHYDHAMDIGEIANRSSASILGSESAANIARGANVPEEQIIVAEEDRVYSFGEFNIRLRSAPHAPIGWRGSVPFDGTITDPLVMPQPVSAMRMGGAWSIIIEHPDGTALIHSSCGFNKYKLRDIQADVVFLGVQQLDELGKKYSDLYWQHTVTATGATAVYPLHFDDQTKPFATVALLPSFIDNLPKTSTWLEQFRDRWDTDTTFHMPQFGMPIRVFNVPADPAD